MTTSSDMYKFVSVINKARQAAKGWDYDYVERYVTDNFFAFSFGDMLVLTTNSEQQQNISMPFLPFAAGTTVCNAFDSNDCQTVSSQGINVTLNKDPKIYLPQTSAFFNTEAVV